MTKIQAEVPEAIYKQVVELAEKENVPVERLVALALAQALGAWRSESVIAERAKRSNRGKFLAVLAKAPDVEPEEYDRLPDDLKPGK
jgi:hypothetical protein